VNRRVPADHDDLHFLGGFDLAKAFERLVDQLPMTSSAGGKTTVINATFENHGVIGSRHEVENWLVDSLDQLKRRGRI